MLFWLDPLFDIVVTVNQFLSTGAVLIHILLGIFLLSLLIPKFRTPVWAWIQRYAYAIGLTMTIFAVSGSLFYSEIAQYTPCKLCWLQRIAIFPLPLLLLVGLLRKSKDTGWFILPQVLIGLAIALFHYTNQVWSALSPSTAPTLNCSTVGYAPSCSEFFVMQYGYITIPMMAITTLVVSLIVAIALIQRARNAH